MASNTVFIHVGCLLEVRADAGYRSPEDADRIFDEIDRQIRTLPAPQRHSTVVDWRRCPLMAPAAAERVAERIAGINGTTIRSAVLVRSDTPLSVLQHTRLIREAGLDDRKVFFDPSALRTWLSEVLTPAESERLRQFLAELVPLGSSRFPPRSGRAP